MASFDNPDFIATVLPNIEKTVYNNRKFAFLRVAITSNDPELHQLYKDHINSHNRSILESDFPNSGFDVFIPDEQVFSRTNETKMINLQIKTEMTLYKYSNTNERETPTAFYTFPRSSISKTELMLANHTGIIDSGYRGNLIGAFRWLNVNSTETYTIAKFTRLLQICHPSLCPVFVELIDESELSSTERGAGGFGSTGSTGVIR